MISCYIKNGIIHYDTDLKVIDNKEFFLAIDGNCSDDYYKNIINLYNKNKYDFIKDIDDYISIYLYDKNNKELLLITDRIGAKKIYYIEENNIFKFGNDIRNLKIKNKDINISILSMYFRHHFIPEPYTIYNNVYKLEHGYYLTYKDNKIDKNIYWNTTKEFNNRKIINNYQNIEKELDNKILNVIKKLTNNKDNIGIYLSGGVDSNLAASFYNKISLNKIKTFTIGCEYSKYNESIFSKKTATYLKSNHHELTIKNKDALNYVHKITDYYCEPFGDASAVATIALNELAHKHNIKYALTGDGADQLFCGAVIYDTMYKIQKTSLFNPLHIRLNNKFKNNKKLFYIYGNIPKKYKAQSDIIFYEKNIKDLFIDNGIKRFEQESLIKTNNLQEKRMILDIDTFMAQRVFTKMCVVANKNNIDILSPYLTKEIMEYSFKIPHKYKYHNKIKKYILKNILYKNIPKELFNERKRGFYIPTKIWLQTVLNEDLKRLSSKEFIEKQNIFNYDRVKYIIEHINDYANVVWDYYMFQLWYEKNID